MVTAGLAARNGTTLIFPFLLPRQLHLPEAFSSVMSQEGVSCVKTRQGRVKFSLCRGTREGRLRRILRTWPSKPPLPKKRENKPGTGDSLHTQEPVTVASFRTWRGWREYVA